MKHTMLEHESIYKNQAHELHRLYGLQRNLVDEVKGNNYRGDASLSGHTSENASRRHLPGFLSPNSIYGEGSRSQAHNGYFQNGFSSKDGEVVEVRPVKAGRKMIDLQLPAEAYLDMDETADTDEITICSPYKRSKSGKVDVSHQSNSSGSCLDVKNSNGLFDLNEPFKREDLEPLALSRDTYSHYGRNNADVQSQWLDKNRCQNEQMVLEAGQDRRRQRNQLYPPSNSRQVVSNNAFQHQSYPTTDHSKVKFAGERAYRELEVRSKNPQASYNSYMESSVASNASRFQNDHRPDFVRPWSHWSSSLVNPSSSSHQKSYPVQTNPYMNFVTHPRVDSSFEMRSRVSNGIYNGLSSGSKEWGSNGIYNGLTSASKETVSSFPTPGFKLNHSLNKTVKHQSFESFQEPKKQECSSKLPWLKPKPPSKSEISNRFFDLNETDTGEGMNCVSLQKGSNNANMGRVEMINPQSSRKVIGCPIFEKHSICKEEPTSFTSRSLCIADQHKEANQMVRRDFDINFPCDTSDSVGQHGTKAFCVEKEKGSKAANFRHYIDLNLCASDEGEDSGSHFSPRKKTTWIDLEAPAPLESDEERETSLEKTKEDTLMTSEYENSTNLAAQTIVSISLSAHQHHPDDAGSSSTDATTKNPLSWFADIITSCGNELERKVEGSPEATDHEGYREEHSSGEIDYLEAMTLSLQPMKEDDYMPKPLVPEHLIFEGAGSNRPRRGQARRGRPKRDFQRDILPGLSSLSRHEVTEDIQMIGGLVETREYTCNSGVARRNSKRKRLVSNTNQAPVYQSMRQPMIENVSVVGLEDRKLTGWGKATRRPRRQRCPSAGNPATVVLT
ncbi:unnamed protein product [Cochlearia groenlandica]